MQTDEFTSRVQQIVDDPADHAKAPTAVDAVMQVLGEMLSPAEAASLGAQLPAELQAAVTRESRGEAPPDAEAFRRRIAELGGIPEDQAGAYADACLSVLRQAVSSGELVDVALQVPWYVSTMLAR